VPQAGSRALVNKSKTQLLIFSDLDGSLLDHDDYNHAAADALLAKLDMVDIPVILITSKTRAEVLPLRRELNNQHPFIVENGAAVFIPQGYFPQAPEGCTEQQGYWVKSFVDYRDQWLGLLAQAKGIFPHSFSHFAAMKEEVIASVTGLSVAQARLANSREYGEPVSWLGTDEKRNQFVDWLQAQGAKVLQGGRFLHVAGDCDKGKALQWLAQQYCQNLKLEKVKTLAIGDSHNDVAMLEVADLALIIRSPVHAPPALKRERGFFISEDFGPRGWAQGVQKILELSEYE